MYLCLQILELHQSIMKVEEQETLNSQVNVNQYQCHTCESSFDLISQLHSHERMHSSNRLFKCIICAKTFTTSSHLLIHSKTHQPRKQHQCKTCDQSFVSSSGLKRHHNRFHNDTVERLVGNCLKMH